MPSDNEKEKLKKAQKKLDKIQDAAEDFSETVEKVGKGLQKVKEIDQKISKKMPKLGKAIPSGERLDNLGQKIENLADNQALNKAANITANAAAAGGVISAAANGDVAAAARQAVELIAGLAGNGKPSGNYKRFEFDIPALGEDLQVVRFNAREGLSTLFQLDLDIICENPSLAINNAINQTALLELHGEHKDPRYIHGIVSRLAQGDSDRRFTTYHVTIVPAIWRLTQRSNCRIFQKKSLIDIITETLVNAGFVAGDDFEFIDQEFHPSHEYCVQYRETDMDFIARLMHEEGMWYYFIHKDGHHKLMISDTPTIKNPVGGNDTIRYYCPDTTSSANAEHIQSFQYEENLRTGSTVLTDYNFKRPALNLEINNAAEKFVELERFDYPGSYVDPSIGKDIARYRLEEARVQAKQARGKSDRVHLVAGGQFTLDEHPRNALNQKYLLVEVTHLGEQPNAREEGNTDNLPTTYHNRFVAIPSTIPYRHHTPPPRPIVEGPQTAHVVGLSSEEIDVDKYGRVKVQFHWDRYGKNNEHSSCWIRVSQTTAGAGWGSVIIPRIGHEVVVEFLEGDPDQPLVTGSVYHGTNTLPAGFPDNKTRTSMMSKPHKSGGATNPIGNEIQKRLAPLAQKVFDEAIGKLTIDPKKLAVPPGSNEISLDDEGGRQEVFINAQKDMTNLVANESCTQIGNNQIVSIGNDTRTIVGNDQHFMIANNRTTAIGNDEKTTIKANRELTVKEGNDDITIELGNQTTKVPVGTALIDAKDIKLNASSTIQITCGKASISMNAAGVISIKGTKIESIAKELNEIKAALVKINS